MVMGLRDDQTNDELRSWTADETLGNVEETMIFLKWAVVVRSRRGLHMSAWRSELEVRLYRQVQRSC